MNVCECMCKNVISASKDTSIIEISSLMKENDIGSIPICDEDKNIVGMITDRDIVLRAVAENKDISKLKAEDIMTKNHIIKLDINSSTLEASKTMSNNQVRRLPVLEDNKLVGILYIGDLARNNDIPTSNVGTTFECICMDF